MVSPEPAAPRSPADEQREARSAQNGKAWTSEPPPMWGRIGAARPPCRSGAGPPPASGADKAADQPLEHERAADEPVRRADELHHLDLTPPGEDREPDRVRDQERRRGRAGAPRSGRRSRSPRAICRIRFEVCFPYLTLSTPAQWRLLDLLAELCGLSSALSGVTSQESGSGFAGRFASARGASSLHLRAPAPSRRT